MMMFTSLIIPELIEKARALSSIGNIVTTPKQWTYLDVDDAYIEQLFPLLSHHQKHICKPEHMGENIVGAHISVIYPEENTFLQNEDLGQKHAFVITGIFAADLAGKRYYALTVEAPSLIALRQKYRLDETLYFKSHRVPLHMTIGVELS